MVTHKEKMAVKNNFVLIKDKIVLGTFGNLKKVTEFVVDKDFPSYWTLVRKKADLIEFDGYQIWKVKHY